MRKEYEAPEMLISVLNIENVINSDEFGTGEEDIPWDKLAPEPVRRTLKSYFADRQQYDNHEDFPIHQDMIGKDQAIKRY